MQKDVGQVNFLFSKISEGIAYCKILVDEEGKPVDWVYLDINEAYERINGVKKADVVGKKATEILPSIRGNPADWINLYGKVALTGEPIVTERYVEVRKKWYHISAHSPQKGYFVSIFEDISERKKAEEEIKQAKEDWERTFDAVPDFIAIVDTNYKIIRANKPMAKQLGVNPEEARGLICYECVHQTTSPPNNCPHSQLLNDGEQHTAEVYEPHLGGYFIVSDTPLRDEKGTLIGSVHVARNITKRKEAEEQRIRIQTKLEENAVLLEEYANQMEELANQRAQQLKDAERMAAIGQTAGMVGHDIRNPLQAITSDMYLITEEVKAMNDGESKKAILENVESVSENLGYINKIVSDLQDYTRPLKPNMQPSNLPELVEGTLLTVNVPKRIEVFTTIQENARLITTDVAYLRRILTNLMTNAVQAMPNDGKLTVTGYRKKAATIITIEDTGVGIPADVKTKLFTPLFTTKSKGQGLGLAVVKRLVEALNGTISFESEENRGTKFILEFPVKASSVH
jgi:PAS domain S-box-containing protein